MVLVTGATGFIGSHLVDRLAAGGHRVRCLVRSTSSRRYLPQGLEVVFGDLRTGQDLGRALEGVKTVFHLAGVTRAARPADYYEGNTEATRNLLRVCSGVCRLIHVSSLAAVGPGRDFGGVDEESEPHPFTPYGRSKLEAERLVLESRLGERAVIVRPPVVYGPRDRDVFLVIRSAARGFMLTIGKEESYFSAIYVKDLVDGLLAAEAAAGGGIYFLAHPEAVSWSEFGRTVAEIRGSNCRMLAVPPAMAAGIAMAAEWWARRTGVPGILSRHKVAEARCRYWICATAKASRELGFRARTALAAGLRETIAWYEEAGWLERR
jgi:nucleoside-diphosphate-sugar epimerase